jgi:ABC-type transport system involved in multi-copper enzyme maturation permease subunit
VTQLRVVRSEWTKFRSLTSTAWTLLVAVVLMVGLGALIAGVVASTHGDAGAPSSEPGFSAITTSLAGITFAQLAIAVLGVLMITGEYTTGMIKASLTVVPRRLPVLWAKLAVFGVAVLAVALVSSFASFSLGQALLSAEGLDVPLSSDGALGSVVGAAVYMTLVGLISVAVGALVRSTAAGISAVVGVFFVLPPLTELLPDSWSSVFVPYLPSIAGSALYGPPMRVEDPLSAGQGLAVLCAYTVVLVGAATWRFGRTDA